MSFISHLQCIRCGAEYPADTVMNLCPFDDGLIKSGDKVVAFNTGSLKKYLPDLRHLL